VSPPPIALAPRPPDAVCRAALSGALRAPAADCAA
jgi:hypothetical protein